MSQAFNRSNMAQYWVKIGIPNRVSYRGGPGIHPQILKFSMVFGQTWHHNINIITNINNINMNILILTLQQTSSPPSQQGKPVGKPA